MKTMMMRGSPVIRPLLAAAAIVIVVFGLKFSSDVLAPIFLAATLAILFTPVLWWLEKKGLPPWLALVVMVLALGGFLVLMIFILTTSLRNSPSNCQNMPSYCISVSTLWGRLWELSASICRGRSTPWSWIQRQWPIQPLTSPWES